MADAYVGAGGGYVGIGTPIGGEVRGVVKTPDVPVTDGLRITSLAVEVASTLDVPTRVTSVAVEVLNRGTEASRVTSFCIEVVRCLGGAGCVDTLRAAPVDAGSGCTSELPV